jgi:hypothetical protein
MPAQTATRGAQMGTPPTKNKTAPKPKVTTPRMPASSGRQLAEKFHLISRLWNPRNLALVKLSKTFLSGRLEPLLALNPS